MQGRRLFYKAIFASIAKLFALLVLGILAALGQAPWGLWPLTVLSLAALMLFFAGTHGQKAAFGMGWVFGVGYFGMALQWIVEPFLVDIERYGWMAPFALILMASGTAVFWGLATVFARFLGRGNISPTGMLVGLAGAEVLRSLIFTGFPWALLGHVWIGTPIAQAAGFVGPHGLTLITLGLAAGIAHAGLRPWLVVSPGLLALGWFTLDPGAVDSPDADAPLVRIVQPNARQDQKWHPSFAEMFFERQLSLTGEAGAPDLVVWPETSIPYLLNTAQGALTMISAASNDAPVVIGALRREDQSYFNTLAVIGPQGSIADQYDKSHLVPFGEYIPFANLLARFGIFGSAAEGGYASSDRIEPVEIPGIGMAIPLICYEGIFAEEVNSVDEAARLMVLITNDAWFGNNAGPAQHLAQAQLRAIEQGIPVVRAANTGISAMIDARGRIIDQLPLGVQGKLDVRLPPALKPPLYRRLGDFPAIIVILLLAFTHLLVVRPNTIDPNGNAA